MNARYETVIIGSPTLPDEEFASIVTSLEGTITEGGGTVLRTEPWGKRKLAYKIQKFDEGHYSLLFYEAPAALVTELERRIRMNERLMRFLTVHVDWEEKVAKAAALKAARVPRPGSVVPMDEAPDQYGDAGDIEGGR